jgi:hypothetical protein
MLLSSLPERNYDGPAVCVYVYKRMKCGIGGQLLNQRKMTDKRDPEAKKIVGSSQARGVGSNCW